MDNEEQRLIQQAIHNSRYEVRRVVHEMPDAPVKRPTREEFENPLEYIQSLV